MCYHHQCRLLSASTFARLCAELMSPRAHVDIKVKFMELECIKPDCKMFAVKKK